MNPLTRALKLAENPPPEAATRTTDRSSSQPAHRSEDRKAGKSRESGESGESSPGRAPRHDPAPPTPPLATIAFGDSPGPERPDTARLAPLRATKDDSDPESLPPEAPLIGQARSPESLDAAPLAPLRATRDHAAVDAATDGIDFAALESSGSIPAALGGVPPHSADAAASGTAAARAVERDKFRSLPGSRGLGRGIGIAASMPVAAGAAAGGSAFLWKTELTRPALVRDLPPRQEAAVEPARAHAGNVAADGPREPAGAGMPMSEPHAPPTAIAARPEDGIPPDRPAETTESGNPSGRSAMAENSEGIAMLVATPRSEGHPAPMAVASESGSLPTRSQEATPGRPRYLMPSAASPGGAGLPSGRAAAPVPGPSSANPPVPETTAAAQGIPTGNNAPEGGPDEMVATAPGSGGRIVITKRTRPDHVAESLGRAYQAYLAEDGEAAELAYRSVLRQEPRNRDARLGLAAVAAQAGRRNEAAEHYATLLASHPADTAARAALIAIAEGDPTRVESGLKALLRIEPEAAHLHFSLGNLYAAESRWPEAQRAWFRAYRLDRSNADHAYNLAVGLDHLSQPRNAIALYREALVLAQGTRAGFEAEAVRERIRILESRTDAEREPDGPHEGPGAAATAGIR